MTSLVHNHSTKVKTSHGTKKVKNADTSKHRPSDDLVARFVQWRDINTSLQEYYHNIKEDAESSSKHYEKHTKAFPVPLREHDQFSTDDNGFQHALTGISVHTRTIAHIHSELAKAIDTSVLAPLKALDKEIGDHIKGIDDDLGKTFTGVDTERDQSKSAVSEYTKGLKLSTAGEGHSASTVMNDPWVAHHVAEHQLHKHLDMENHLTQSTIHWQSSSKAFEARLISTIQEAARAYTRATVNTANRLLDEWTGVEKLLTNIGPTTEWNVFANSESGRILDPSTKLREPSLVTWPGQDSEFAKSTKEGALERKARYTKIYTESHCVLTPSGFLHCYPKEGLGNADKTEDFKPKLSLYLPEFTLGPPTEAKAKKHKFHLTSLREQASGKDASRGLFGLGKKKNVAYSFKAKSHEELLAWWDALDKVTKASQTKKGSPDPNTTREDAHEGAVANLGLPAQNGHNTIQEEPEHMTASPTDATKNETFSDAPTSPSTPTSPSSPTSPKQTTHQRKFSKASTVLSAGGSSMEEEEAEASRARQAAGGVTNEASLPEYEPAATSSKA